MTRYVAWLRGINVGGHHLIPMNDLCRMFEAAGLKQVTSFIQSGNVLFESGSRNPALLVSRIQHALRTSLGYEVGVMIRTMAEVEDMVNREPFKNLPAGPDVKWFVTFLAAVPRTMPPMPWKSPEGDVEVLEVRDRDVFSLSRLVHGRFGFANPFLEKRLGVAGTTRGWPTVVKVVALSGRLSKPSTPARPGR